MLSDENTFIGGTKRRLVKHMLLLDVTFVEVNNVAAELCKLDQSQPGPDVSQTASLAPFRKQV